MFVSLKRLMRTTKDVKPIQIIKVSRISLIANVAGRAKLSYLLRKHKKSISSPSNMLDTKTTYKFMLKIRPTNLCERTEICTEMKFFKEAQQGANNSAFEELLTLRSSKLMEMFQAYHWNFNAKQKL